MGCCGGSSEKSPENKNIDQNGSNPEKQVEDNISSKGILIWGTVIVVVIALLIWLVQ